MSAAGKDRDSLLVDVNFERVPCHDQGNRSVTKVHFYRLPLTPDIMLDPRPWELLGQRIRSAVADFVAERGL